MVGRLSVHVNCSWLSIVLEKAFEPQRRKDRKVKSGVYLTISLHLIGPDLHTYKYLNLFALFAPLR